MLAEAKPRPTLLIQSVQDAQYSWYWAPWTDSLTQWWWHNNKQVDLFYAPGVLYFPANHKAPIELENFFVDNMWPIEHFLFYEKKIFVSQFFDFI